MDLESARRRALSVYQGKAAQGDAFALERVGTMHFNGVGGLAQNNTEAVLYWNRAAEKGDPSAWNQLAIGCLSGLGGLAKSEAEALRCAREAVKQGSHLGNYNLGLFYYAGTCGLANESVRAVSLWRESIRLAPIYLSTCSRWLNSNGLEDVAPTLCQAIDAGSSPPELALSYMYLNGLGGLSKSETEAIRWLEHAANRGDQAAKEQLDTINRSRKFKESAGEVLGEAAAAAMRALVRNLFK